MPPKSGRLTGFLDVGNREIRDGDIVRYPVEEPYSNVHGSWSESRVVFRNGVWLAEYWRSEKGQVLPVGYGVHEMSDWREYEGQEWRWAQNDEYRRLTVILASEIEGAGA